MYLADTNGSFSDYCLNIGEAKDNYSYYLTITKCTNASYLFKYNIPFTDSYGKRITSSPIIAVYKDNKNYLLLKMVCPIVYIILIL